MLQRLMNIMPIIMLKDRPGAVVKVTPLSQKVLGSSQPLCMQGKGLPRLFLPQTPLTWELPALGLSFTDSNSGCSSYSIKHTHSSIHSHDTRIAHQGQMN